MRRNTCMSAVFTALLLWSTPARADWLFTPFIGGNIGGDTVQSQTNFGVSAAFMGAGAIGFEFDASWTPDFFDTGVDAPFQLVTDSRVSTYMFNAIVGAPVGGQSGAGARPYGSVGVGWIQSKVESELGLVDIDSTEFGWNVGGGVMGFFNDNIGARGDVRYFKSMQNDLESVPATMDMGRFGFWRVTGGVVLRWGTGN